MATAYTPGLTVSSGTIIRKTRRLPLKGAVTVQVGDKVEPSTVVARTDLPGIMQTVRLCEQLGIDPAEIGKHLLLSEGDIVARGTLLAEVSSLFGLLKSRCVSPIDGTLEMISPITGNVGIRRRPVPVEVTAYINGTVSEIIPDEGVVIETAGALVQGIFGVGGERLGEIIVAVDSPDAVLDEDGIREDFAGKVVVAGADITGRALKKAASTGAAAVIAGGIIDRDLVEYLGHDIGVAITGQEEVPSALVVTEGFGIMPMAARTFNLLKSLEGRQASVNGATQIRAGVIRPEIIVTTDAPLPGASQEDGQSLDTGARIRIIREPYFGLLATVTGLPRETVVVESGAKVRILTAKLATGEDVTVPRANVEIIEG
jgi:hypothetical protein